MGGWRRSGREAKEKAAAWGREPRRRPCFLLRATHPPTHHLSLFPSAVPACIAFSIYSLANEHPHEGDKPEREYTNVRSKPFPWGEKPLFDPGEKHH